MSIRTTLAGLAAAVVLGTGALIGGSLATATSAEAAPGWHGGHGHHGHFGHSWRHPRPWGEGRYGRGWGYRPAYYAGYYGGCRTVLRTRFVPGLGYVERPVTRCY
jgi:hypothetical protein